MGTWPSKCRERVVCSRTEKYRYYVFMSEGKEENVCASHDGLRSPIRRPNAKEALFIITLKFYHQTNIYKKNKTEKGRGQRRNEREREREREYVFSRAFYTKACF